MKIFATNVSKALKLGREEIEALINSDNYDEYIEELTANKGCSNFVADDEIVVLRADGEYHVPLSQLNQTVYHVEKHTAEDEILKMLRTHLLSTKTKRN